MVYSGPSTMHFVVHAITAAGLFVLPMIVFEALIDFLKRSVPRVRKRSFILRMGCFFALLAPTYWLITCLTSEWLEPSNYLVGVTIAVFFGADLYYLGKSALKHYFGKQDPKK